MDEYQTGDFSVGLDFSAHEQCALFQTLFEFAEIPLSTDLHQADIIFGDGGRAREFETYIYFEENPTPNSARISAKRSLSSLQAAIARARSMRAQNVSYANSDEVFSQYVGISDTAVEVRQQMAAVARQDVTVLVTGESGTGKEVVAKALHVGSTRAAGPFVPVNCGAIPSELIESELFGHEKGAFTGAITQKTGRFELAHGGTLFLDEIGDLPFQMQVKVLRAIEQKNFERVGGTTTRLSDVRIVAATNKNLEQLMQTGEFREDLYYRLNVFPIELAPLRERSEDLPLLVNTLVSRIQQEQGLQVRLSVDALSLLSHYPWPGNVRELGNLLQRLAIQYPHGLVRCENLPRKYTEEASTSHRVGTQAQANVDNSGDILLPVNGIDMKDYLARLEKSLIEQALEDTNSVVARAADRLHIRRTTLVEKMRKHGLGRGAEAMQ